MSSETTQRNLESRQMHPIQLAAIQYFYADKNDTVIAVANKADGITHHQIYDLLRGRIQDPTHLAVPLYNATGYLPFVQALVEGAIPSLMVVKALDLSVDPVKAMEQEEFDIYDQLTSIRQAINNMDADGRRTKSEKEAVLAEAELLQKEVVEFINAVKNDVNQ